MDAQSDKFLKIRQRAEAVLSQFIQTPLVETRTVDELVHEITVHQAELEIQLEDLQHSYRALETAQQRYADLFNFAPIGYIETDQSGGVINANQTVSKMLGVSRDDMANHLFAHFISRDFQDIYHVHRRQVIKTQQSQVCEVQIERSDGTLFHALLDTVIPDTSSTTLRTTVTDISILKQTEDALHRALADEKDLNDVRTRVFSVISHEFRTPLAIILAAVESLDRYNDQLNEHRKKQHFDSIRNFVWYLNDMVASAQTLAEFDSEPRPRPSSFDIVAFVQQLMSDLQAVHETGQTVTVEVKALHEQELVTLDMNLVRLIMINLVNNALKYSTQTVTCALSCEPDTIRLQVIDQGIGISEKDQLHLYEALYRGKNTLDTRGAGLGLFIVKRAVEALGATIQCDSQLGKGTTFTVEFPRHIL